MAAIAPSSAKPPLNRDASLRVTSGCARGLLRQIGHVAGRLPGQSSVSKLDALDRFRLETPFFRVLLILILTPLLWLSINLLLECIPLNDPSTGFWRSGFFQLRMGLVSICSAIAPVLLKLNCVPDFPINSTRAIVAYALFQTAVCLGTNAIISLAFGVFPVPFSQFTVILPMAISGRFVFFRLVPDNPEFHALSDKVNQWLGMETLPILVYPVFTAVFTVLTPSQQLWVSLLLPVLKLAVRAALWTVAKNDDDLVGVITCCVGHLYHVLFTAMILQNAKSYETLAVVVLFSTAQMLFNCRCILADAERINETKARVTVKEEEAEADTDNLRTALTFAQELRIAQNLHWRSPSQLLSTYLGYRGAKFMELHRELLRAASMYNAVYVYNTPKNAAKRGPHSNVGPPTVIAVQRASRTRIMPWNGDGIKPMRPQSDRVIRLKPRSSVLASPRSKSDPSAWAREEGQSARKEALVHAVASALHQSEMVLLRSYVSISMTLFYVTYMQAVFHLKNRRYFATFVYLTTPEALGTTIHRLLLLCAMETVFLTVYLVLIWRRLRISGFYQLAFVLWSQRVLIQAKLYVTIVILGFPLTHHGNDSILRFRAFE